MFIEKIELRKIKMEYVSPFETSLGREYHKTAIIVKIETQDLEGFGECVAEQSPWYSYETVETAWHVLSQFIIPTILKRDVENPEDLLSMLKPIRGHNMACAAIEEAFIDAYAKARKVSLSKLLGGVKNRIESGVSIGIQESVDKLLEIISNYLEQNYHRIKVKIKPQWDIEVVEKVREAYPDISLMVDANGAYTINDLNHLQKLDKYNLLMIEQPLDYDDLVYHAELQSKMKTPICLDESVPNLSSAQAAIKLGSCKIINIKVGRVGGLQKAKQIHDYCQEKGVPVWCGGMLETGIGRAINVAIASLPNYKLPNDISASTRYYKEDIVEPPFQINHDGTINVPQMPGIGVDVIEERLEKVTKKKKTFT
ncbi:MAG: o-succinylbenzoate synthase [Candidatus Freyarchaeota archaeon]|nr:o-succinylbenzoate synthase [Candidatus Jordarchaeia archaeon]MBS7269345.1 o-succinylbenzoate synthase [Candidatus Jordarchaeia archaeon]MBS7278642.1 o-succinylbenzoate synthase [Candidatus Jordarchaeia archaeon]